MRDSGGDNVVIQFTEDLVQQGGFAHADFAADDDEAVPVKKCEFYVCQRLGMLGA